MSPVSRTIFAVLGLSCLSINLQAKVATLSLDELARKSDLILIAEVERVEVKADVKIGRVRVIRFIKGATKSPIAFVAQRTWTCDMSEAVSGERVLLFLTSASSQKGKTMFGQNLNAVQASCKREGAQLYVLSHSGRGRIRLSLSMGQWVANVTQGDGRGPCPNINLYVPRPVPTLRNSSGQLVVTLAELIARTEKAVSRR